MKSVIRLFALLAILILVAGCASPESTPPAAPAASPAAISQPEAIALANKFYGLLFDKQDFAGAVALFDDTMKAALPASKLKEIWETLPQQVGSFQSRSDARPAERQKQYERIVIPLQFEKMPLNMLVVVDANAGKISGLFFQPDQASQSKLYQSPTYVDPGKFEEQEVKFGAEPWTLPGTLALPKGDGPFPAVALVHGSGPNDRDESIGPNKPFKDLAQGLASQGIAVLRYDKRTKVYGDLMAKAEKLTVKEETIDDAAAAVEFLRTQPKIDPEKIFVVGHSLGGYLAPRIAEAQPHIAGMVIMAGPTRPLEDLMVEQTRYILESDGSMSAQDQAQLSVIQQQVDAIKVLTDQATDKAIMGAPASYWLDLKDYRPAESAQSLTRPLLIIQGERDYQVTLQDFGNWRAALSGKPNVQFKSYPDLNHLFVSGSGHSTPNEYQTPGNVSPQVIADIAAWIQRHR